MIRTLALLITLLWATQALPHTYTLHDRSAQEMIQQRDQWHEQLQSLLLQVNSERTWRCQMYDHPCKKRALQGSEHMYFALSAVVDRWEPLFAQTSHMLHTFNKLELPEQAALTRQQYQTYLYLIQYLPHPPADKLSYIKGKLGLLADYQTHFQVTHMLAAEAGRNRRQLHHIRALVLQHIEAEKAFIRSL